MNNRLLSLITLGLLTPGIALADYTPFDIKIKPNSPLPEVGVYSDASSKMKYTRSRSGELEFEIEVRGQCPQATAKLVDADLYVDGQRVLNIPVSGDSRSLTGNSGKTWEAHTVSVDFENNQEPMINLCNLEASQRLQTQSHDEVFNSNFVTGWTTSGKSIELRYECFGGLGFADINYPRTNLLAKSRCEATGYESKLYVEEASLSVNPITGQDGTCKVNIDGQFSTNFELYRHRSNNSTKDLRYRFKFQDRRDRDKSHIQTSDWWERTANPVNGGAFVFNYTDRLPSTINYGKITLEVDIDGEIYRKPDLFSINCEEALPLQQTQTHELSLSVVAEKNQLVEVAGQLCPSHARISAELAAASSLNGKMLIIGSTLADIYPFDFSVSAGGTAKRSHRVELNWSAGNNNVFTGNEPAANNIKKQTLNYGLRVLDTEGELVKQIAKSPFEIRCELPTVNPVLPGGNNFGMLPDHTGSGAGNDVLIGSRGSDRKQQGRMLTDSDFNTAQKSVGQNRTTTIGQVKTETVGSSKSHSNLKKGNITQKTVSPTDALVVINDINRNNKSSKKSPQLIGHELSHTKNSNKAGTSPNLTMKKFQRTGKPADLKSILGKPCNAMSFKFNKKRTYPKFYKTIECVKGKIAKKKTMRQKLTPPQTRKSPQQDKNNTTPRTGSSSLVRPSSRTLPGNSKQ